MKLLDTETQLRHAEKAVEELQQENKALIEIIKKAVEAIGNPLIQNDFWNENDLERIVSEKH